MELLKPLIRIHILLTMCMIQSTLTEIAYPSQLLTNWVPANYSSIKCPTTIYHLNLEHQQDKIPVEILKPTSIKKLRIDGFLCHKVVKTTHCNENWLFISEISHELKTAKILKSECSDAIINYNNNLNVDDDYPLPSCAWNMFNSVSRTIIHVIEHSVRYDQYSMSYIDNIFLNGHSVDSFSNTIYDSTIWKAKEENDIDKCVELSPEPGFIYQLDNNWFIWGETIKEQSLSEMCELTYCGYHGMMSKKGEWIYINSTSNLIKTKDILNPKLSCKNRVNIRKEYKSQQTNTGIMNTMGLIMKMKCQDIINKLLISNQISNNDLSYLVQQYQGIGPVYRLENKTLNVATGIYKIVRTDEMNNQSRLLGSDLSGNNIYLKDWVKVKDNLYYGINGIMLYNDKIILPLNMYYSYDINRELRHEHKLRTLPHPVITILQNKTLESNPIFYHQPNRTDIVVTLYHISENLSSKISRYVGRIFSSFNFVSVLIYTFFLLTVMLIIIKIHHLIVKPSFDQHQRSNFVYSNKKNQNSWI